MKLTSLWFFSALFIISACSDSTESEKADIENYLNNLGWMATDTAGVYVVIEDPGTADRPTESSIVEMNYTAKYLDDTVFDESSSEKTIKIKLSTAINGLKFGLSRFGKDGKGTIIVPSALGYGNNPPFGVRKNAVLVYSVHVVNF
jgi:FKBP-type peptidyl-prolyl cis-trans isomerase FkpA